MVKANSKRSGNLAEDCVAEALLIVGEHGVDKLSLREVARRLGVSHGAPYKHFPSRDHLLAEIVRRSFDDFARHLDRRPKSDDVDADMAAMGMAYIDYALAFPLQYRLMFSTTFPNAIDHPEMKASANHAFDLLLKALKRKHGADAPAEVIEQDALFVWGTLHGLAGVLRSELVGDLKISPTSREGSVRHVLGRIGDALSSSSG
jgi:AcrR family transcriptional regulator